MLHSALKPIAAWLVSLITLGAPPGRPQYEPAARESIVQAEERYQGIAEAIAEVAFNPKETPVSGNRTFTAALLAALAYHESGFRRDVDLGIGRALLAKSGWNDFGRSWCMMQLQLGAVPLPTELSSSLSKSKGWAVTHNSHAKTTEGWSGLELLEDRNKCFTAGLHVVQRSIGSCKHLRQLDWLRSYASGNCTDGASHSALRMRTAIRWARKAPGTWRDADVVKSLTDDQSSDTSLVAAH